MDLNDQRTFELIRRSETLGCFQIESPGQPVPAVAKTGT
ncbi:hypothetical protein ACFWU3_26805 [Streptomyces sp. NPDC058685]